MKLKHPAAMAEAYARHRAFQDVVTQLHLARQRVAELEAEIRRRDELNQAFWRQQKEQSQIYFKKLHQEEMDPKRRAQKAVNDAVLFGILPRITTRTCADCGEPARHYHHENYAEVDWLKVIPLCRRCHFSKHTKKSSQ